FEPEALSNGDLVLKQKSISIGSLNLPVSYVMKFISDNYKIPKGVDIRPNDKLVYVNMQQLKLKSDIKIKVNKFDLKKNDIVFTLVVPVK
ncbi:MAG TPA: YpmS family protein, partial [Neobacillus sp.]